MNRESNRRVPAVVLPLLASFALCGSALAQGDPPPARGVDDAHDDVAVEGRSANYVRRHALVVGIDDYQDAIFPDLGHAEADARGVAKLLVDFLGFEEDDVRLILGADATKDALEAALVDWACDPVRMGKDDILVVFFAGHGVTRTLGARGARGYLVPVDAQADKRGGYRWSSLVGMRELEDISEAVPAKHALFVLDCCFGGLAVDRSAPPVAAGLRNRARQILTAGAADQTVLDGGGDGHSVFTATLLEAVRGAADLDGDRVVTFGELYNYVGRQVEARTASRQTPLQATLADHEGGCVALFAPGVEPGEQTITERLASLERDRDQYLEDLERFSDALLAKDLLDAERTLWPQRPHRVADISEWLGQARDILSRLELHQDFLRRVRQEAYMRQIVAGIVEEGAGTEPDWSRVDPKLRWKFVTLDALVRELAELAALVHRVEGRLTFANEVVDRSVTDEAAAWDEAIAAVAADPRFDGLVLTPQVGLVPIGADPESGLWEFLQLDTGVRPVRDEDTGRLYIEEETGIVLVLVPGGSTWIGSSPPGGGRNPDPHRRPTEGPVHEVRLDPYFISKYEMTQGQWERIAGQNPSEHQPGDVHGDNTHSLSHPVEYVSYEMVVELLARIELVLPTEVQWEHAARAGSDTPWFCGDRYDHLFGYVNLADQSTTRAGVPMPDAQFFPELDDGWVYHAPVDEIEPNLFGLYHVHGNVWEWCLDPFGKYEDPAREGDGYRSTEGTGARVVRGGSYRLDPRNARSALRFPVGAGARDDALGVRPARPIMAVGLPRSPEEGDTGADDR